MIRWYVFGAACVFLGTSCSKDDDKPMDPAPVTTGLYVLNEGSFNGNNTSLSYYDFSTSLASTDFYQNANGSSLGDTGNDMLIYGSKLYIIMNVSSYVEIADAATAKSIKKLEMADGANKRSPRYAVPYKNKVLISSFDGTVAVLDTASLTVDKYITVGANPEQMEVVGDVLYVANSGGLSFPDYDSTVSVVNLNTFTEVQKIVVGTSPTKMASGDGKLFVICSGNYMDIPAKLVSINVSDNLSTNEVEENAGAVRFYDHKLYLSSGFGATPAVKVLNATDLSLSAENYISDGTSITAPYSINFDPETGDLFVTDAKNYISSGEVFCFGKDGKKKYSFLVTPGINPNKVIVVKK